MVQAAAIAATEAVWPVNVVIEEEEEELEAEVVAEAIATIEEVVLLGARQRGQRVKTSSSSSNSEGHHSRHSKKFDLTLEHNSRPPLDLHPDKTWARHHAATRSAIRNATVVSENASARSRNESSASANARLNHQLLPTRPLMPATLHRAMVDGIRLQLLLLPHPYPITSLPLQHPPKHQQTTTLTPESSPSKLLPQSRLHHNPRLTKLNSGLNGSRWQRTFNKPNRHRASRHRQLLHLPLNRPNRLSHKLTRSMSSHNSSSSSSSSSRKRSMDTRILSSSPRCRHRIRRRLRIRDCSITIRSNSSSSSLLRRLRAFRIS